MSDSATRREVALAGHLGDVDTVRAGLVALEPAVRATALGALARIGVLTIDDVASALGDPAPAVRSRAAELAAPFGAAGARMLVPLLTDRAPSVVESACFALGEVTEAIAGSEPGDEDPEPEILTALCGVGRDHNDPVCREAAVAALGSLGAISGLPTILAATSDKPAVRRRAVLALAPFSGPEVDAALERALTDRDWQVRQAAEDLTVRQERTTS